MMFVVLGPYLTLKKYHTLHFLFSMSKSLHTRSSLSRQKMDSEGHFTDGMSNARFIFHIIISFVVFSYLLNGFDIDIDIIIVIAMISV